MTLGTILKSIITILAILFTILIFFVYSYRGSDDYIILLLGVVVIVLILIIAYKLIDMIDNYFNIVTLNISTHNYKTFCISASSHSGTSGLV